MNFNFIGTPGSDTDVSKNLLEKACAERGLEFIELNPLTFDFTQKYKNPDLLYRASVSKVPGARHVERFIIQRDTATFYNSFERSLYCPPFDVPTHQKADIPMPKTITFATDDKDKLEKYSASLGGFPLVIKVIGGSHGVGLIKVESLASLFSTVDYLVASGDDFILREFINSNRSARLIVLGNKVIDSIEYIAPKGDFRSNVGEKPQVRKASFSKELQQTAVKAVTALGVEFGGVDIMIKGKRHVVTEMNFPCFFPRCQLLTKTDIAGKMVDYLLEKKNGFST